MERSWLIDSIAQELDEVVGKKVGPFSHSCRIIGVLQGLRVIVVLQQPYGHVPICSEITIDTGPLNVSLFRDLKKKLDVAEPSEYRDELLPPAMEEILKDGASRLSMHSSRLTLRHTFPSFSVTFPVDVLAAAVQLAQNAMRVNEKILKAQRWAERKSIATLRGSPFRGALGEPRAAQLAKRRAPLIAFEKTHLKRWRKQERREIGRLFMSCVVFGALILACMAFLLEGTDVFRFGVLPNFMTVGGLCGVFPAMLFAPAHFIRNRTFKKSANDFIRNNVLNKLMLNPPPKSKGLLRLPSVGELQ